MKGIPRRALAPALAVVTLGLLGVALSPGRTHALQACFTDPIVKLSNGQLVDLSAAIADTSGDVQSVAYSLVLPSGVTPTRVIFTGGALSGKETFSYTNADSAATQYTGSVLVTTATPGVGVTAQEFVVGSGGHAFARANGQSGQTIVLTVAQ